jgi:hypothetical protein
MAKICKGDFFDRKTSILILDIPPTVFRGSLGVGHFVIDADSPMIAVRPGGVQILESVAVILDVAQAYCPFSGKFEGIVSTRFTFCVGDFI